MSGKRARSVRRASRRTRRAARRQRLRRDWALFRATTTGPVGLALLVLFALMAVAHPLLIQFAWAPSVYHPVIGYDRQIFVHPSLPSAAHPLGTDTLGRDVLSELMYSARSAFALGIVAAVTAMVVSVVVGLLAAYCGGVVDAVLMQASDLAMTLPPFILLLLLGIVLEMETWRLAVLYGALSGLGMQAVVIKTQALSLRVKPYVDAARVAGGGGWRIMTTHMLPGLLPLGFLNMLFTVTGVVMAEALLSFFGRTQVRMSWGTMVWFGQSHFLTGKVQWHVVLPAALAMTLFCSSFYLIGRALEEVWNPRLRDAVGLSGR